MRHALEMPPHLDRLIYVDDSGHPNTGLAVYGWIEFSPDRWPSVLRNWLDTRKSLWRESAVPVTEELHTTQYVNGRGRISTRMPDRFIADGRELWKDFGRSVATTCLEAIRCSEGLTTGAVYRRGAPEEIAQTKRRLYADFIAQKEQELAQSDSLAMVFMDGDGSDTSYRATHRNLALDQRRVIEDAIHLDSSSSQLIQMADLVAWVATATIDRHHKNAFAGEWYAHYLAERDRNRGPVELHPRNSETP